MAGREPGHRMESGAEMCLIAEADFERDVGEADTGLFQQLLGFFDAAIHQVSMGRHAGKVAEAAREMRAADADALCQVIERQMFAQACVDEVEHAIELAH